LKPWFQIRLAAVQHDSYNAVSKIREQAEADLAGLSEWYEAGGVFTGSTPPTLNLLLLLLLLLLLRASV
jgi:hypothetical protein